MQTKMKIKIGIDLLMTVLLLLLMAYQITGQELHEWFGAGELLLFLLHNILNNFTSDGSLACHVRVVSLWQKGYFFLYVP